MKSILTLAAFAGALATASEEDLLKVAGPNHLRAMRQMEKAADRR